MNPLGPEKALIFRITHLTNVAWILANGLHCNNSLVRDPTRPVPAHEVQPAREGIVEAGDEATNLWSLPQISGVADLAASPSRPHRPLEPGQNPDSGGSSQARLIGSHADLLGIL